MSSQASWSLPLSRSWVFLGRFLPNTQRGFLGNVSSSVKVERKSGKGEYLGEGMPEVGNCEEAPSIVEMAALRNMEQRTSETRAQYLLFFQSRKVF